MGGFTLVDTSTDLWRWEDARILQTSLPMYNKIVNLNVFMLRKDRQGSGTESRYAPDSGIRSIYGCGWGTKVGWECGEKWKSS